MNVSLGFRVVGAFYNEEEVARVSLLLYEVPYKFNYFFVSLA